jgi:predicted RNA-binding Zn-ribbon protein involved in translation (DUF1610 family)
MKPLFDIGQIIRSEREFVRTHPGFTAHQKRMLRAIADCRTPALGAHKLACTACGSVHIAYNSCRNRNCPKCQSQQRERWIQARQAELLPVPYFHLVFTLPDSLNPLCRKHPKVMYSILFRAVWYTVKKLAADPRWIGGLTAMTAILHTWGSNLQLHPHLHCIVPGGALKPDGLWQPARSDGRYLFNREVMGLLFRARFARLLRKAIRKGDIPAHHLNGGLFKKLFAKQWITYAKRPFAGPQQVLEYLGRYTHKVAITNHRILKVDDKSVSFRWKDYRQKGKQKVMTLSKQEFIRRFALHIIPHRFVRIRHYGILANRHKTIKLTICRNALKVNTPVSEVPERINLPEGYLRHFCPDCKVIRPHYILEALPPIRGDPAIRSKYQLQTVCSVP